MDNRTDSPPLISLPERAQRPRSVCAKALVFADPASRVALANTNTTAGDRERRIFLRGDQALPYGNAIAPMGEIGGAGYGKVARVSGVPKQR
ncbi:hypothetical protein HT746_31930 [Burkholderia pyrrocinia]|uniref:hypothetical protein n=1 Tax=Burkholderia pyrrocinia TaxID=60550 RepID=UPI001576EBF1|nr:hypothetical protein [Burkholderia pyrrocinia]NTX31670.1 hypothetical protein [Burkholderia pyrrocinia]